MSGDGCGRWINHQMVGFGVVCVSEELADFVVGLLSVEANFGDSAEVGAWDRSTGPSHRRWIQC